MRSFAQAERFVSEVEARTLRPVYVFVGDEVFFRQQCREAILQYLVPADMREFSLFDFDLSETDLAEILDRARTPSLMAPFQIFFVRGVKALFTSERKRVWAGASLVIKVSTGGHPLDQISSSSGVSGICNPGG